MKIHIITRAVYRDVSVKTVPPNDEAFTLGGILTKDRLQLMQHNLIDSLKRQVDKGFRVHVLVGDNDQPIRHLDWGSLDVDFHHNKGEEPKVACRRIFARQPRIQARVDSDDWVSPGWTGHIRETFEHHRKSVHQRVLIHYEPLLQDPKGLLSYHPLYHKARKQKNSKTSCFIVLLQTEGSGLTIYETNHTRMPKKVQKVVWVGPGYAFLSVHDDNRSSNRHSLASRV